MGKKTVKNIIAGLLLLALYYIITTKIAFHLHDSQTVIADNWSVIVNGNLQEESILSEVFFPVTNIGDNVELTTVLPDNTLKRPVMRLWIYHSIVRVYVDDELIYSYGEQLYKEGKMVGNGMHWIDLPEKCAGKRVKICFDVTEDAAFSSINPIYLMESSAVAHNLILEDFSNIVISVFLVICGIMLVLISFLFGQGGKEEWILFYVSLFSICVAIWMLSSSCALQLLTNNLNLIAYFEYFSLYLAPIPILLYMYNIQDNRKIRTAIGSLVGLLAAFNIVVFVLNFFNWYHLSKLLSVYHIIAFGSLVLMFVGSIVAWKQRRQQSDRMMLFGLGALAIIVFDEIVRFNVEKYIDLQGLDLSNGFLPLGVLAFMFTLVSSYMYRLMHSFYESVERKTLMQMAYTDGLTHIANRAMCEKVFQERDEEKKPTTIINFDLNYFKKVNDTFGHSCGDELLITFANLLHEVYGNDGFVGRMGGDEFIVVLDETDEAIVDKTLENLNVRVAEINKNERYPFEISFAYGYYSAKDGGELLSDIYKRSDKKMYEQKTSTR